MIFTTLYYWTIPKDMKFIMAVEVLVVENRYLSVKNF